jgi:hypothetical protein
VTKLYRLGSPPDDRAQGTAHFKLVPFEAILARAREGGPKHLIRDFIPRRGVTFMWGAPKTFKSFVALDMAMHISLPGMQHWHFLPIEKGPVVYFAFEGAFEFTKRVEAFQQNFLHPTADKPEFYLVGDGAIVPTDYEEIIEDIRATGVVPACVMLDTFAVSVGGEGNEANAAAYLRAANAIVNAFGCAVVVIHHCGYEESRMRGSSALRAGLDCEISVTRDAATDIITVKVEVARDMANGATIYLKTMKPVAPEGVKQVDSLVIVDSDPPPARAKAKGKRRKSSRGLTVLKDAIAAAAAIHGQDYPGEGGINVKSVAISHVRDEHKRLYIHTGDGDKADAQQKAFRRALEKARDDGDVGGENDLVWLRTA